MTPKETPRKPRQTSSPSYRSGTLAEAREAVILDVGSIPEVTFEFFSSSVLPVPITTSTVDVTEVTARLISLGYITNGRWHAFPTDPAKTAGFEDVVFSGLVDVNNNIIEAANLDHPTTCIFIQRPHQSPTSTRANKTRPDGCRLYSMQNNGVQITTSTIPADGRSVSSQANVSCNDPKLVRWEDIVEAEEYKKKKSYNDVRDVSDRVSFYHLHSGSSCI